MESDTDYPLPPFTQLLQHQVAGHKHGKGRMKLGVLKHVDGSVLKPLPNDYRGEKESSFYQLITESSKDDAVISELACFMPKCGGTWTVQLNNSNVKYLRLEDIAGGFSQPCNLDVKIGAITYDPDASAQKRKHEQEKYPEAEVIGFRILGMHVYDESSGKYMSFSQEFGKSLTTETIISGLHVFLNNESNWITLLILSGFLHRLKNIENWFSMQRRFAFYCSSLLFFYEGKISVWLSTLQKMFCSSPVSVSDLEELLNKQLSIKPVEAAASSSDFNDTKFLKNYIDNYFTTSYVFVEEKALCSVCYLNFEICRNMQLASSLIDVRMIDFAHVYDVHEEDKNYIFGLRKLIEVYQKLQKQVLQQCKTIHHV